MQGSYYLAHSNVTYSPGSVLSVERQSYQTLPCGYGSDTGGCRTDKILKYIVGRFGSVASFSGSYVANGWTLNMQRTNLPSGILETELHFSLCILLAINTFMSMHIILV